MQHGDQQGSLERSVEKGQLTTVRQNIGQRQHQQVHDVAANDGAVGALQ
jgi:hypothetical protein